MRQALERLFEHGEHPWDARVKFTEHWGAAQAVGFGVAATLEVEHLPLHFVEVGQAEGRHGAAPVAFALPSHRRAVREGVERLAEGADDGEEPFKSSCPCARLFVHGGHEALATRPDAVEVADGALGAVVGELV